MRVHFRPCPGVRSTMNNNPTLVELADLWLVKHFMAQPAIVAFPLGTNQTNRFADLFEEAFGYTPKVFSANLYFSFHISPISVTPEAMLAFIRSCDGAGFVVNYWDGFNITTGNEA